MNKETKENINKDFMEKFGMTYDEFALLDYDDQYRLITDYHKKHPVKETKDTLLMIGGGDESIIIRVPKGQKIWTPDGYYIAGETLEENRARMDKKIIESGKKWKKLNKRLEKEIRKVNRLDLETRIFLRIIHAKVVEHPEVIQVTNKLTLEKSVVDEREVYIFRDYEEYKNFYLMYLDNVDNELINIAIRTKGNKGQIVALKGLCEQIIYKSKLIQNKRNLTQEEIDDIHARGKITPDEKVLEWESLDLCAPGDAIGSARDRCYKFNNNCHECLVDYASMQDEYDPIEFKVCNAMNDDVKKLTKDKKVK